MNQAPDFLIHIRQGHLQLPIKSGLHRKTRQPHRPLVLSRLFKGASGTNWAYSLPSSTQAKIARVVIPHGLRGPPPLALHGVVLRSTRGMLRILCIRGLWGVLWIRGHALIINNEMQLIWPLPALESSHELKGLIYLGFVSLSVAKQQL